MYATTAAEMEIRGRQLVLGNFIWLATVLNFKKKTRKLGLAKATYELDFILCNDPFGNNKSINKIYNDFSSKIVIFV